MANTVFKYHQHHPHHIPHTQQQHGIAAAGGGGGGGGGGGSGFSGSTSNHNQNNSNQNSIFVLNAETKITASSCSKFYLDFNDNSVDSSAAATSATNLTSAAAAAAGAGAASCSGAGGTGGSGVASSSASSSVWSSASSTMCSPAAHAIQKLFNCSSGSSSSSNGKQHGSYAGIGIDSKAFKTPKSELLKKKSKFWQYLEGEAGYEGIDSQKGKVKSRKPKSKYWSRSYGGDNQNKSNNSDLSELLEYSCSLCDNCRCIDCQIGYFDCDNSDDSNSEYSFHMSGYEEDEDIERGMELKTTITASSTSTRTTTLNDTSTGCGEPRPTEDAESLPTFRHNKMDNKNAIQHLEYQTPSRYASANSSSCYTSHRAGNASGSGNGSGGGMGLGCDLAEVESCHQCYGLEVEQHCLDFHRLYSECGDRNH